MLGRMLGRLLTVRPPSTMTSRGLKSDLPVKWIRPEKQKPYSVYISGDLEPAPFPARDAIALPFLKCPEIEEIDDRVKTLLSVGFQGNDSTTKYVKTQMIDRVRRHAYDEHTIEARIARLTGAIRIWQNHLEKHPRDGRTITFCKEAIERRRKFLKYLRRWDYKRYEWLLEKLQIAYKPPPVHYEQVTRKRSVRKLTKEYCKAQVAQKLEDYKVELQKQKEKLLKEYAENPLPLPNYKHEFKD